MKNVKSTKNDVTMNNSEGNSISKERIEPVLVNGAMPNALTGKDSSKNVIAMFDEFCGENGGFVREGNFEYHYRVGMENLENHYGSEEFEFENLFESGVYKFDCPSFTRTAKSVIFLKSVQNAVADIVGSQAYYIVSDRGNLYVSSKDMSSDEIIDQILVNDGGRLENEFTFYTINQVGKFNEERSYVRGE